MCSGRQMNRLLQGDVGSGKTLVALMTMLIALDNGYQACMMAPTEILAEQHLQTICDFLQGMDIRVELLTGIVKGKKREKILVDLATGDIQILVGTHAILEDPVVFRRLGVAVIDEQHRFGVAQRAKLWNKSENPPHILVMTATPIPRTLAMTIYGDLDVSVIDELPVALAIIRLSLNTLVKFVIYGVSPQPAQAPEYSNFGFLKLTFFTVNRLLLYLSLTLFLSKYSKLLSLSLFYPFKYDLLYFI